MERFHYLPTDVLDKLSFDVLDSKYIYRNRHSLVGKLFWSRLTVTIKFIGSNDITGNVLEFGCGSGIILPTLSKMFKRVVGIDLNIKDASIVKNELSLDNVELVNSNILDYDATTKFDLIIANDVLEHIWDLRTVLEHLHRLLADDGHILISSPTENWLYRFARLILNVKKPDDHYHTADEIINLMNGYFSTKKIRYLPIGKLKWLSFFTVFLGQKS